MDDNFAHQLTLEILNQAQERRFTQFRLLRNWQEYQMARQSVVTTELVIKVLRQSADKLFKQYCKAVITGISDINQLMAYSQLHEVMSFYKVELATFTDMVNEYAEYLRHGNFLYAYTGGDRF